MVRIFLLAAVLTLGLSTARGAETVLADPPPSFDSPHKVMLTLSSKDPTAVNNILFNVVNVQKFYCMDNVEIAVIAYGAGVRAFLKGDSPVPDRISSLLKYDVQFVACGNTLTAIGKQPGDLIEGVGMVTAGIPEIVERRLSGWNYVHP